MTRNKPLIVGGCLSVLAALLHISCIFGGPEWYLFFGAGIIVKLPLLRTCLVLITTVYILRGVAGLIGPFFTKDPVVHQNSMTFWIVSSLVCCVYGIFYFIGTKALFSPSS